MKNFILQVIIFLTLLALGGYIVFLMADGKSDPHYLKLTSPRQTSLILGTSKAAQGVRPEIINEILGRNDIYNFSFTLGHSPYGPVYFKSIQKKLKPESKNGIFILTVDPYSLSSRSEKANKISSFRENNRFLGEIKSVNSFPNIPYLLFHYPHQYIYIITRKLKYVNDDIVHEDGWEEVNISMKNEDVRERKLKKIEEYKEILPSYNFSAVRYSYLEKTVKMLLQHGEVYLVRLPVSEPFLRMENSVMPDFDFKMQKLSSKYGIEYFDFVDQNGLYQYTDGNHLYKTSGLQVSREIAECIKRASR